MANIDKTNFIQTYGIDDDNFISYLNKFDTFKKIINMGNIDIIPIDKLNELYYRFIYYNSLGHNLDTIVDETLPIIKKLFYYDNNGFCSYTLPPIDTSMITLNYSTVTISDRICQVKLLFTSLTEIPKGTLLFEFLPSPYIDFRTLIQTNKGNKLLRVVNDGILFETETLPINTQVNDSFTFIIRK